MPLLLSTPNCLRIDYYISKALFKLKDSALYTDVFGKDCLVLFAQSRFVIF